MHCRHKSTMDGEIFTMKERKKKKARRNIQGKSDSTKPLTDSGFRIRHINKFLWINRNICFNNLTTTTTATNNAKKIISVTASYETNSNTYSSRNQTKKKFHLYRFSLSFECRTIHIPKNKQTTKQKKGTIEKERD